MTAWVPVRAEPWVAPGDVILRHDLQRLSDSGLLAGPLLSWPVPWSQVLRSLDGLDNQQLERGLSAAVERLRARAQRET
ncbi:MAG: hypothetical protein KBE42_10715, partial [Steroidobacteraceae bacterium]|nr:hypothetical protein [Steroidobacteraceae bacterium]